MSEENTEVALYRLPSVPAELESAFISDDFVDQLIGSLKSKALSVVGDVSTAKGRKAYISMAANVRSSKVAIDDAGKNLVAEMKKRPALVDASRRKIREELDALAVQVRMPVTEWEAEQDRIKAEEKFNADHAEALEMNAERDRLAAERFESDFELALLLDEKIEWEAAEAAAEKDRQRIAYERELQRKAAGEARRESEAAAQRERDEAAQREAKLIADAEQADRDREAEKERAEREKQEAIETERRKAQQAEQARLAEEKRAADELAARAADESHRKAIGTAVVNALIDNAGLTRNQAIDTLMQIKDGNIPHACINY